MCLYMQMYFSFTTTSHHVHASNQFTSESDPDHYLCKWVRIYADPVSITYIRIYIHKIGSSLICSEFSVFWQLFLYPLIMLKIILKIGDKIVTQ